MNTIEKLSVLLQSSLMTARFAIANSRIWDDGDGGWWMVDVGCTYKLDRDKDNQAWLILALEAMALEGKLSVSEGTSLVAGQQMYRVRQDPSMYAEEG